MRTVIVIGRDSQDFNDTCVGVTVTFQALCADSAERQWQTSSKLFNVTVLVTIEPGGAIEPIGRVIKRKGIPHRGTIENSKRARQHFGPREPIVDRFKAEGEVHRPIGPAQSDALSAIVNGRVIEKPASVNDGARD